MQDKTKKQNIDYIHYQKRIDNQWIPEIMYTSLGSDSHLQDFNDLTVGLQRGQRLARIFHFFTRGFCCKLNNRMQTLQKGTTSH